MTVAAEDLALARHIAYKIGSKWALVEIEDLTSELTLWLFENEATVDRYRELEGGQGKLFLALRRIASKYCAKETMIRSGAPLDSDAAYSKEQIERALPFMFEDLPQTTLHVAPVTGKPVSEGSHESGLALSIMMDMRQAFSDLPPKSRYVLELRFRDDLSYGEIATLTGTTDRGAAHRVGRAITRIQESLSGV